MNDTQGAQDEGILAYRAEDLSPQEIVAWTVLTDRERSFIHKLKSPGQRLLTGPRGCGKSTYLRYAYFECLQEQNIFPVYVNYSKSISLEPELTKSSAALATFRQWILANIIVGIETTFRELGTDSEPLGAHTNLHEARALVEAVEQRRAATDAHTDLTVTDTLEALDHALSLTGRSRAVLLLDDAAHAFSADQQREFFEVFASLRSRSVSAKAAVYPGITTYTSKFHVGHDAQVIDVWMDVDDASFLPMMKDVAQKRLTEDQLTELARRDGLLEYLALASFGLPRAFINMLSKTLEDFSAISTALTSSVQVAGGAIKESVESAEKIFMSLENKLPRYKNFVALGNELLAATVAAIKEYNDGRSESDPRTMLCLYRLDLSPEIERILGFLEYAGLARRGHPIRMGDDRYEVITVHYGVLIKEGALNLGRNPKLSNAISTLEKRVANVWTRRRVESLLGADYRDRCRLNLEPCPACDTPREVAEARFCFNCGTRLEEASVFQELLGAPVNRLAVGDALIRRISEDNRFTEVKDILMDEEQQELLKIKYIGPVRASKIYAAAEEFVYE